MHFRFLRRVLQPKPNLNTPDRGAELLYGERKQLSWADAVNTSAARGSASAGLRGRNDVDQAPPSTRSLTEEERARLKERYSMEYSRYLDYRLFFQKSRIIHILRSIAAKHQEHQGATHAV